MSEETARERAITALSGVVDRGRSTTIVDGIIEAVQEAMFDNTESDMEDRSEYVHKDVTIDPNKQPYSSGEED